MHIHTCISIYRHVWIRIRAHVCTCAHTCRLVYESVRGIRVHTRVFRERVIFPTNTFGIVYYTWSESDVDFKIIFHSIFVDYAMVIIISG